MTNATVEFTDQEYEALTEYAKFCQEDLGELIRKIVIQDAGFMKGAAVTIPERYQYFMQIPEGISIQEEEKIIEYNHNKIRKILGLPPLKLQ